LVAQYGALAEDHGEVFPTLLCGWDDAEQTRKRGMALGITAPILPCNDGRLRSAGLPSLALLAAWENGDVEGELLTEEQFKELSPQTEI
jgi:hypothetical protein